MLVVGSAKGFGRLVGKWVVTIIEGLLVGSMSVELFEWSFLSCGCPQASW